MKDPRLKIFSVIALSLASFLSAIASVFTIFWWIVHDRKKRSVLGSYPFWIYIGIILLFSILVQLEKGGGVFYLIRFATIALVAMWAYRDYHAGEFLKVAVWSFGKKWGFELGLMVEMSMQGLRVLEEDMDRIHKTFVLKGIRWGGKALPNVLSLLLVTTLRRADAQAQLLALRGYKRGGELCPHFSTTTYDIVSSFTAILILAIAIWFI